MDPLPVDQGDIMRTLAQQRCQEGRVLIKGFGAKIWGETEALLYVGWHQEWLVGFCLSIDKLNHVLIHFFTVPTSVPVCVGRSV